MNVLAPVQQSGKLTLAGKGFTGFKTGEYTVRKPSDRVRAMSDKSIDNVSSGRRKARDLTLADVCNWTTTSLKKSCANTNLIVVHSKEIDDAGEANVGIATFETWLQQIKSAWTHLRQIGVQEFVFTADHGFLLQDETTREITYGTKRDPKRRYVLSNEPRQETDVEDGLIAAGADEDSPDFDEKVAKRLEEELASITGGKAPEDMARVLRSIFELKQQGDFSEASALISWLSGSENVAASAKRIAGIKGDIGSREALDYLQGILEIVKAAGYKGLVIVIDEAETILRMRRDIREKSLNNL
jgi:hypothetical protein